MQVVEINLDGSETQLDLDSNGSNLSLESTVIKFAHRSAGSWSYAVKYSLRSFPSIAPVYHYFNVTTTSRCHESVLDELIFSADQELFEVSLPNQVSLTLTVP